MKKLKSSRVTQAILWAAALIGTSLILRGSDQAKEVFMLLLVLATVSTILPRGNGQTKTDCAPSSKA